MVERSAIYMHLDELGAGFITHLHVVDERLIFCAKESARVVHASICGNDVWFCFGTYDTLGVLHSV